MAEQSLGQAYVRYTALTGCGRMGSPEEARFNDPDPVPECLPLPVWRERPAGGMERRWMTSVTGTRLGLRVLVQPLSRTLVSSGS